MFSKTSIIAVLLFAVISRPSTVAQPGPLHTLKNVPLFFPASELVTNGAPGLTDPASRLMVSALAGNSAQGGPVLMVNTQVWTRYCSAGPGTYNTLNAVALDDSGNVCAAGRSGSNFIVLKYSSKGDPLWTNHFIRTTNRGYVFLAADGLGCVYVSGAVQNTNNVDDAMTVRYTPDGTPLWTNLYNPSITNAARTSGLVADETGNSYVAAVLVDNASRSSSSILLKYDPAGNLVWTNGYVNSAPSALARHSSGSLYMTCITGAARNDDYAVLKYSSDGLCLWTNRYDYGSTDWPTRMALDQMGNVVVTGDLIIGPGPAHLYGTVKYQSDGTPLWTNVVEGAIYEGIGPGPRIAGDPNGNVFVGDGGAFWDSGGCVMVKLDPNGVPLWTNRYSGFSGTNGVLWAIATDSAGNLYASGYCKPPAGTHNAFVLVKYGADGTPAWTNYFTSPLNDHARAETLTISAAGACYVTGQLQAWRSNSSGTDAAIVKFADYVLYTPPPDFVGQDNLNYIVTDSSGNRVTNTVSVLIAQPLILRPLGWNASEGFRLQLSGAAGTAPAVLYGSSDMRNWEPVATNTPVQGSCEFRDTTAGAISGRFYRAVQ